MSTPGARILDMIRELEEMRGCILLRELNRLSLSEFILETNYADLKSGVEGIATDPRVDNLLDVRQHDQIELLMMHVARLIHNFAAAVMSLKEHTMVIRRVWNLRTDGKPFPDLQARIEADFANDPVAQFILRFRNYCQHCGPPPIAFNLHIENGHATKTFVLDSAQLLEWDGWTAPARRYLLNNPNHVDILAAASAYRDKVLAYNQWFDNREREIFADEIQQCMDKQRELFLLRIDANIDGDMASSLLMFRPKELIFSSIFSSQHFALLEEQTPPDSRERGELAIAILEREFFAVPDDLKRKIEQYFLAEGPAQDVG